MNHDEQTIDFNVHSTIGAAPPPGLEQHWSVGTSLKVAKLLEDRQQVVACALLEVAMRCREILLGVVMVCPTVLQWNTGKRDALICKLLRGKLQELDQNAPPDRRPLSQPPMAQEVQTPYSQRMSSSGGCG